MCGVCYVVVVVRVLWVWRLFGFLCGVCVGCVWRVGAPCEVGLCCVRVTCG